MGGCNEWIINPSRHLRTRHKLLSAEVKKIISKAKTAKTRPLRYDYPHFPPRSSSSCIHVLHSTVSACRQCPACPQRVVNLSKHASVVHKMPLLQLYQSRAEAEGDCICENHTPPHAH
jgi:hypothetical protein